MREVMVEYVPKVPGIMKETVLKVKVNYGQTYIVNLTGKGYEPCLHFNTTHIDFGNCFLYKPNSAPVLRSIQMVNKDTIDISVELRSKLEPWLQADFKPTVIAYGQAVNFDINFLPITAEKFSTTLEFLINGLSTRKVHVQGRGVPIKLITTEIGASSKPLKTLKLGTINPRQVIVKRIRVTNKSLAPISGVVNLAGPKESSLMNPQIFKLKSLTNAVGDVNTVAELKAGEYHDYVIKFSPTYRIPAFREYVNFESSGQVVNLMEITGACASIKIVLDNAIGPNHSSIPFGAVALGSSNEKKLLMTNEGDIGSSFEWKTEQFAPDFSIKPDKGFIAANQEVVFDICFKPTKLNPDIRYSTLI